MDWTRGSQCIMNVGVSGICSNLGYVEDGEYIASDDCEELLEELLKNLQEENPVQRAFRRQLCFSRVVELDVIPLVKHVKHQPEIFSAAIRFLAALIQPVECLTLGMPPDISLPWLGDVKRMLLNTRKLCTDKDLICAVTTEITTVIDDHDGQPMSEEDCDFINKCLLLFRNLLYLYDVESQVTQEQIILYLLECGLGDVINKLVKIPQREYWSASIVQMVSLMYTRHTLEILQPCLILDDISDKASVYDSDDPEYHYLQQNNNMMEDDQTDKTISSFSELPGLFGRSLCVGEERMDACSGITDQDPDHTLTNENMRIGQTQEDKKLEKLRYLLLKFTSDFILEGFGYLVHDLKNVLISDMKDYLDDTYFLWALAFFLKVARKENVPFGVIRLVMTTELFGFLAYEGVTLTEQLLIAKKKKNDVKNNIRRLHLTISAINELLKTLVKYFSDPDIDEYDREYLIGLQKDLANITDLKMVFILLLRHYQSEDTSLCFLEDLITTNHTFLELVDTWSRNGWMDNDFDMLEHIKMYGTNKIMEYYGVLLEKFENNSPKVNRCLFTMLHHVSGDCDRADALMQLPIIQALMEVDSTKNHVTKEMNDLTEYVLNKFMNLAKHDPLLTAQKLYGIDTDDHSTGSSSGTSDSAEIDDMLFSLYTELQKDKQMVEKMAERFADVGITVTLQEIWSKLNQNGLISDDEYLANKELVQIETDGMNQQVKPEEQDVVQWCIENLKEKNQEDNLKWIQTLLCETAYVKLGKHCERNYYEEPVTMFHVVCGSSVPLVLYKEDQEALLHDEHFITLLHYLGFHTPQDVDMIFPRIPSFWSSEQLIKQAEKLGPISKDILKFDPTTVKFEDDHIPFFTRQSEPSSKEVKDLLAERPVVKEDEHNVFWLKQIQQYNLSQG